MKTKIDSRIVILAVIPIIFVAGFYLSSNQSENSVSEDYGNTITEKFAFLSTQATNVCGGAGYIEPKGDDERLQGSCCSKMDSHRYSEQVEGLKKYSNIDKIPSDPYDISVLLAKELLDFQENIKLTSEQQAIYNEAMGMADEGGPCCCICWRWYAFDGQAKYLITELNFTAEQIAEVWDLEDGCGGTGHTHTDDH